MCYAILKLSIRSFSGKTSEQNQYGKVWQKVHG